jgi:hypothetical protein
MEKHITLVGILNIVYSGFALIGSLVLFAVGFGFRYIMEIAVRMDPHGVHELPAEVFNIVPIVLTFIGAIILLVSIAGIIGAIGVIKRKEWGRITVLVISFFHLIHIPLGTILGVYSIWALLNDEMILLFNPVVETKFKKK